MISVVDRSVFRTACRAGLLAGLVVLLAAACSRAPEPVTIGGPTMGTTWSVRLAEPPPAGRVADLRAEIEAILEAINSQMSTYRQDALITRFNHAEQGERFTLPPDFATVLLDSLALARDSGGAFDPTVGPLVNLWGFGPEGHRSEPPAPDEIAAAQARVGWERIEFDASDGVLEQPGGMYLDFSSIAKGHAVDRIADLLEAHGVEGYVVDIGGDLRTRGTRADGRAWRIAVERPLPGERSVHSVITPGDMALATSGSYRNYFRDQGRVFSHTIDPRSGWPVAHDIVSVTVLHERCAIADGLATVLTVLNEEEGMAFARRHGLTVLWLVSTEDGVQERMTPEFARFLEEPGR
jgi:FAD:protein FMN transferase